MEITPGIASGLAFNINYNDRINQLHANEELNRRAANDAASKASLYAADADFQSAMNGHDAPLIKSAARETIRKMGEYRRNNPDMMYNPDKLIQFNLMKRELRDNPDLTRGLSSDNNYKEYVKDLQEVAKNPQQHDTAAYDAIKNQWNNYLQYGNQNGLEAAQKEGKKAFLYSKPQDFVDLPATLLKAGNNFNDMVPVRGKDNLGEWWTAPNGESLNALKRSIYQQHGRQIQVQAQKLGLNTPEQIDSWITNSIKAGIKSEYHIGDVNAQWDRNYKMQQLALDKEKENNKKGGPSYTPFDYLVDKKNKAGTVTQDEARVLFGDKPHIELTGIDGTRTDLTGLDYHPDGRYVKRDGIPLFLGRVRVPLEVAKQKGIVNDDDRISANYIGQAAIEKDVDKDGKGYDYVNVSYQVPINPNDQKLRQRFNSFVDVDKLVPASKDPYANAAPGKKAAPSGAGVDQAGNVFSSDGKYLGKIDEFQ